MKRLASVTELESVPFRAFISWINGFARVHRLRVHENWSKIWEYPWVWRHVRHLDFPALRILDLGSEISPMPWFFASLGSEVQIVETNPSHAARWRDLRDRHGFRVRWSVVSGSDLPVCDGQFDLVTSYSVIEHMSEKSLAIDEAARALKPGGLFCLTFDICERDLGMTFPEWNGIALDMETFDRMIWSHPDLEPCDPGACWNVEDIEPFLQWHRTTAPHHNYVVGGAMLRKRAAAPPEGEVKRASRTVRVHQIDTGLGSGNTGDDAMFLAAHAHLPARFALTTEVHALSRASLWPRGVGYIDVRDEAGAAESIAAADLTLIMGDTPVMDAWGLDWPLRANARKLDLCHRLKKPVHCVGVGVDRLEDREAAEIFRRSYLPISSWSVRSEACRQALIAMEVPERRIVLGADWAWLLPFRIDRDWAMAQLGASGCDQSKTHVGVNLVHERWRDDHRLKHTWAEILDRVIEVHDAQVFFFCNESRTGDYYDRAAAQAVQSLMRHPSALLADQYFTPDQMLSLIASVDVTISQRYHFTLFSVLADVCPVSIERGQKMRSLNEELGLPFIGTMDNPDREAIVTQVGEALRHGGEKLAPLRQRRAILSRRALLNLSMLES